MWHENLLDCQAFILEQNLQCTFLNSKKIAPDFNYNPTRNVSGRMHFAFEAHKNISLKHND